MKGFCFWFVHARVSCIRELLFFFGGGKEVWWLGEMKDVEKLKKWFGARAWVFPWKQW